MKKQSTINNQPSTISFWHPASLICTVFGVGKIPFAPGTWGSLVGGYLVVELIMLLNYKFTGYFEIYRLEHIHIYYPLIDWSLLACFFALGVFCSNIYEKKSQSHDSKKIVIDEAVGQALTIFILGSIVSYGDFIGSELRDANGLFYIFLLSIPFITFRFFDIVKRGPVGWIDRNVKGGLGVMLDDVVAGVLAGITSALIFWLLTVIA